MIWAPVIFSATHFDMSKEMNEPPMPKIAQNSSKVVRLSVPSASRYWLSPNRWATTDSTRITAMLVRRNNPIRFMGRRNSLKGFEGNDGDNMRQTDPNSRVTVQGLAASSAAIASTR
mgnify:CR=1 FL=1